MFGKLPVIRDRGLNYGVLSGISRATVRSLAICPKIWLMLVVGCDADWQVLPDPLWL